MLNVVKDFGKKAVDVFKQASWVKRIVMILVTILLVDLLTTAAFYKLLFTGVVVVFVFRRFKHTALYTVVSAAISTIVGKLRNKTNE